MRVPALPRLVQVLKPYRGVAGCGSIARGPPAALDFTMTDSQVPRDENDFLVEEEMEDDAADASAPAQHYATSLSEDGEEDVTVRVSAASPSGGLSFLCSGTTASSAGGLPRVTKPLPSPSAAPMATVAGAGAALSQDGPAGGGGGVALVVGGGPSPVMSGKVVRVPARLVCRQRLGRKSLTLPWARGASFRRGSDSGG